MTKVLLSIPFFLLTPVKLLAQDIKVSGKVLDEKNRPVSFASIHIKNTSKGVSANAEGFYTLHIDKSETVLVFTAIGYKSLEKIVPITNNVTLNVNLVEELYTLQSVTIKTTGEDPAYAIIRKAIAARKTHLNEINSYTADVYIKGLQKLVSAPKKFFGKNVQNILDLDTNRKSILYLSESWSEFAFQRPNKIREEMVSSKMSGQNNAFSFNQASDFNINFYNNLVLERTGLNAGSFVSPIADNALSYYRYKLLGINTENGLSVNKIEVIPKRKTDLVFQGVIYIEDSAWHLTAVNLNLTKATGINFVDTLNINQKYLKIKDYYVPSVIKFTFKGNVLKFRFEGYYVGVFSNYQINPLLAENFFTPEILKINKLANQKDSLFWAKNRPIPLTAEEKLDYKRKDSIALRKGSKSYLDSLEKVNNRFNTLSFIWFGHSFNDRYNKISLNFDPLQTSVLYNTVEGFALKYSITYRKILKDRKSYWVRPEIRYGFKNKTLTGSIRGNYYYNPLKLAGVDMGFGNEIADLNPYGSNSLLSNSINSLLFERNLSKFYKRNFISLGATSELANGFQAYLNANFTKNHTLRNTAMYRFKDYKDRQFTSNNPFTPESETPLFPVYRSFSFAASLEYAFAQKYVTRPDGKFYEKPKFPHIKLTYVKGLKNIFKSDIDYDLISVEIKQEDIRIALTGYLSFIVGVGKFLNNRQVYYPDKKHFWGNNSTLFATDLRCFRYLDFYLYNTDKQYFEMHSEHNFAGSIIRKIPLIRNLKLEEYIGFNYLTQPDKRNYTEYYFGLKRLLFGFSYGWSYEGLKKGVHGFRFTYAL